MSDLGARLTLHRAGGTIARQHNARASWDRRDAIVVALRDGEGRVGLGEAAPLDGFVDERREIEALRNRAPCHPATCFALELAELDLAGQRSGTAMHRLLGALRAPPRNTSAGGAALEVSALLGDPGGTGAIERAHAFLQKGARTLKLKLGSRPLDQDVAAIASLRASIGTTVTLIGDANGAWSIDEARAALLRLAPFGFDYVEQPVAAADLRCLGPSAIAVWADESLVDPSLREAVLDAPDIAGIVCKPTMLGGLALSARLALRAHLRGKRVVVTHALEGPIALAGCAALALALGDVAPRAGLWPHGALTAFPAAELPGFVGGILTATERPGLGLTAEERDRILALPEIEPAA